MNTRYFNIKREEILFCDKIKKTIESFLYNIKCKGS